MPLHDRVWLHEVQAVTPLLERAPHQDPKGAVGVLDPCPLDAAFQHGDLVPEREVLDDQALTRAETLHSYTLDAAYAAHQEDRLGSLEQGKWADFIIVDRDYFEIPAAEIDDIKVLETWVGGHRVYSAAE